MAFKVGRSIDEQTRIAHVMPRTVEGLSLSRHDLFHDDLIIVIAKKVDVEAVEWKGDVVWTYHQGTSRGG